MHAYPNYVGELLLRGCKCRTPLRTLLESSPTQTRTSILADSHEIMFDICFAKSAISLAMGRAGQGNCREVSMSWPRRRIIST